MSQPKKIILNLLIYAAITNSYAAEANRGLSAWSAFKCATYAEMSGMPTEQERLFTLGFELSQSLLNDIQDEKVSEAELRKIPIGFKFVLAGPSIDFIIGRMYSTVVDDTYDSIVKSDSNGILLLDPSKWADDELKKSRAQNKFRESNCELLGN